MTENRERWGSKIGFILAATGSAIGLGNIWKFPYIAGENGGAAFIFIYLICIGIIGFPVLMAEVLLGRTTQRNPVGAFRKLSGNTGWIAVGGMGILAGFLILSFYSVVGGWTLGYVVESLRDSYMNINSPEEAGAIFERLSGNPWWTLGFHMTFFIVTMLIVYRGVQKGIERSSKILMPVLFFILVALMIRGLTLAGADAGMRFLWSPDWSKINAQSILIALGHAFFTLSLGMGAMMTYGSYMSKQDSVPLASFQIVFLDTLIALMAGVAIFTAVFASGLNPAAGPGLIFHTLPAVFAGMPGGGFFGFLFFLLLGIAAITSAISLLEVVVAYFVDEKQWDRHKAVLVFGISIFLLGVPSALSFNLLADAKIFGMTFFDIVDYLASNILLPFGGLLIAIFVAWIWRLDEVYRHMREGAERLFETYTWFGPVWMVFLRFVAPLLIAIVLLNGLGLI